MWFIVTLIVLMLLADAWWWLVADRLLRHAPRPALWRSALALFMAACTGGLLFVLISRFSLVARDAIGPAAIAGLFIWHFLVLPVVAVPSVLIAVVRAASRLFSRKPRPSAPVVSIADPAELPTAGLSRRAFLGATVATVPPLFTIGGTIHALDQLDEFRVRKLIVPLKSLPIDLDGMTIAHVTDIHVGTFTRGRTLSKIVAVTNSLGADLVLQTGDLINHALADLPAAMDMTQRMSGKYGQFLCEGNHDLIESRAEFERMMLAAGVPILINRANEIRVRGARVQLLGLRWGRPDATMRADARRGGDEAIAASMRQLLPERRDDAFQILLGHHPHAFDVAAAAGIPLTLSGHTHGGQLHLTERIGFGPYMYRYWSGLYRKDDSALVVSNGVGNWFPLRINAPAEIVHITLRRA